MHDAGAVRVVKRIGDLHADVDCLVDAEWSGGEHLLHGLPVNELHHDVTVVPIAPDVVDVDDTGVYEVRYCSRLPLEARDEALVANILGVEELDRDAAAEDGVLALMDARHAARSDAA